MKVILLFSGGLDSTVLLWDLLSKGEEVNTISIDYGQKHRKELQAAGKLTGMIGVRHDIISVPIGGFLTKNCLTSQYVEIPKNSSYVSPVQKLTVVPNRNAIFLSVAYAIALTRLANRVVFAAHHGDREIYPDCREGFINCLSLALQIGNESEIKIEAPFLLWTKKDIVTHGRKLKCPLELTWTCYGGGENPCGECGACIERTEAENN